MRSGASDDDSGINAAPLIWQSAGMGVALLIYACLAHLGWWPR